MRDRVIEFLPDAPYIGETSFRMIGLPFFPNHTSGARGRTRVIALVLILIVLLPALFYSAFEIASLSRTEDLVADIYRREMDAILFSLNQYTADVTSAWAGGVASILQTSLERGTAGLQEDISQFSANRPAIKAVFVADSTLEELRMFGGSADSPWMGGTEALRVPLEAMRDTLHQLWRVSNLDYRKIEPFRFRDVVTGRAVDGLLFVMPDLRGSPAVVGILLDEERYIQDIVLRKAEEIARDEFIVGIIPDGGDGTLVTTAPVRSEELSHTVRIWMLPRHSVGIRLVGEDIEEVVRSRFTANIILILLLDVILLAGAWFVFRSMKREVEFAQLKSDFVSSVSHELRTPLALIRMYAETLEMGRLSDEGKKQEYYSTILHETERLSRLVNNVLNFARQDAGRKRYHFTEADLNDIVRSVMRTYEHHLQIEEISPIVDLCTDPLIVRVDPEAVAEALINVVDNAVKYSLTEKFLRIESGVSQGKAYVSVEDRGAGIPWEHQAKIFEQFYRGSGGDVQAVRGSGLGLTLVKRIMDAHGGSIDVVSTPGKGSTFTLNFPVGPAAEATHHGEGV